MKILIFGASGQVGWELQRSLSPLGEIVAFNSTGCDLATSDFAQPEQLATVVRQLIPDIVVNAAALTDVDRCEAEPQLANTINATAPATLAREAAAVGAWMVHYSTDYVFDGSGRSGWTEASMTAPLSAYGRTKLAGDMAIQHSGCRHLILRTSWVYSARRRNFVLNILRLASERDELRVVDDQVGAPTSAELLADVTAHTLRAVAVRPELAGTYHIAASGETSRHAYASQVVEFARAAGYPIRVRPEEIIAVRSEGLPTRARRPLNSRLDTRKLQKSFGMHMPDWHIGVERAVRETVAHSVAARFQRGKRAPA